MTTLKLSKLYVRQAKSADVPALYALSEKVYGDMCFNEDMLHGQINIFPEGQFVAEYEGEVVGYCATFIIEESLALAPHTWSEITGHGFAARHNPAGDYLYGMEVCVDPRYRGLRMGKRLYEERKRLCKAWELKGIVFGGRIPGYAKKLRAKLVNSPEEYLEKIQNREFRDKVVNFQIANDFEIIGVLPNYLKHDKESMGYAAHMIWRNPYAPDEKVRSHTQRGRLPDTVRIASVQFQVRKVDSIEQFEHQVEYFVDVAADYKADFVLFPELLTLALLSIGTKRRSHEESIEHIAQYTERYVEFMHKLAMSYNINIIGGSHPTWVDEEMQNISYIFLRDGSTYTQPKIHPTPNERYWWNMKGGNTAKIIPTDCGPIGVLICYDSEFPEVVRHLVDQGAVMLFVPFCTDERQGYLRVRYCCQARAVENQIYVATAGIVGNLPDVENMDIHYAESGIFTPCDFPFARDGIAAMCAPNTEMITLADLRLESLFLSRNSGSVQNLKDRRFDLYHVGWKK